MNITRYTNPLSSSTTEVVLKGNGWTHKVFSISTGRYGAEESTPVATVRATQHGTFTGHAYGIEDAPPAVDFESVAEAACFLLTASVYGSWKYAQDVFASEEWSDFTPEEITA